MAVSTKRATNLRIDPALLDALEQIRDREGIPVSEQVRRGIRLWLQQKGETPKTKKASTTKGRRA